VGEARPEPSARARRSPLSVAVVGTIVVVGALWVFTATADNPASPQPRTGPGVPLAQNRPAPKLAAPLLRGPGTLSVNGDTGSVVVVNFWASWCRACRIEASDLDRVWSAYRGRGVRFVGVDYEDRSGAAIATANTLGMRYPSVRDPTGSVGDAFGIVGLPTTYVIDPGGRIRFVVVGRVRATSLGPALDSVLASARGEGSAA
jgi:cytochrome c biogenesis protein CcmG/thiol:disulfide interchange protein DsbE